MTMYINCGRVMSLIENIEELTGTYLVCPVDGDGVEKDRNGFLILYGYIAYGRRIPDWMEPVGTMPLDPGMYRQATWIDPEQDWNNDAITVVLPLYQDDNQNWYVAQEIPGADMEVRFLIDEPGRGYVVDTGPGGNRGVIGWFGKDAEDLWSTERELAHWLMDHSDLLVKPQTHSEAPLNPAQW